jgi:hypothetical protein
MRVEEEEEKVLELFFICFFSSLLDLEIKKLSLFSR